MNNKRYAYCTTITKNRYIPYIILNKKIMEYLECKYPFIVLVTENISDKDINKLLSVGCIVKKIPYLYKQQTDMFSINFSSLLLLEYDLILTFEADFIFLTNHDNLFDLIDNNQTNSFIFFKADNARIYTKNKIFSEPNTIVYFTKPNKNTYKIISRLLKLLSNKSEHDLARTYYYHNIYKINDQIKGQHCTGNHFPILLKNYYFIKDIFFNPYNQIDFIYEFLIKNKILFDSLFFENRNNLAMFKYINSLYIQNKINYNKRI